MLSFPANVHLYLANNAVDGRKSFNGLAAVVESQFNMKPMSGDLFIFLNKRSTLVRMLFWDRDGFCIISKRLEAGTFKRLQHEPKSASSVEIDVAELTMLLEGVEAENIRRAPRWKKAS